jgi:hypothetical protein
VRDDKLQLVILGAPDAADAGGWCSQLGGRVDSDGAKIMGHVCAHRRGGARTLLHRPEDTATRRGVRGHHRGAAESCRGDSAGAGGQTYKVNHVLRARTRTALADLIRRRDDLQVNALMNTLCLADGTVWSEASRLIRRLPNAWAAWASRSMADAAFTGAILLIPELLGGVLGATVEVPMAAEVRSYLVRWEAERSTHSLRTSAPNGQGRVGPLR